MVKIALFAKFLVKSWFKIIKKDAALKWPPSTSLWHDLSAFSKIMFLETTQNIRRRKLSSQTLLLKVHKWKIESMTFFFSLKVPQNHKFMIHDLWRNQRVEAISFCIYLCIFFLRKMVHVVIERYFSVCLKWFEDFSYRWQSL